MLKCNKCGKRLYYQNRSGFCKECYIAEKREKTVAKWLETGDTGCGVQSTLRNAIRDYIYNRQNDKCAICGMKALWNDKPIHFILDHIDGNATNNSSDNVRLICPNCDSQLDTYKARNKGSARKHRERYYEKNFIPSVQ